MKQAAVVIGASGGIGSALARAIAASGRYSTIHGISRTSRAAESGIRYHNADIADEASVQRAAASIGTDEPVGLVIIASGLLHEAKILPEKALRMIDPAAMARLFAVNTIGPAIIAKHFVPLLPRQGRSIFAALSARVGSIEDNRLGGWYSYRASKAALNQVIRTLAIELKRTRPEAIALALHPGTVATDLSKPFRSDETHEGLFSPHDAAANLLKVLDQATQEQSGALLAWNSARIPY
jgi:NAD(P)-dependent dehydrogenase (short-subunit alcohol dehydrogenase family)